MDRCELTELYYDPHEKTIYPIKQKEPGDMPKKKNINKFAKKVSTNSSKFQSHLVWCDQKSVAMQFERSSNSNLTADIMKLWQS